MAVAHGGQTVLSGATATLARDALPEGVHLVDLGPHRLRDLAEPMQVFQLTYPSVGAEFPPLRSLESAPGNLPRQVTTFIGREREVDALSELVRERPLVTLTGVGGVGKAWRRTSLPRSSRLPDGVAVRFLAHARSGRGLGGGRSGTRATPERTRPTDCRRVPRQAAACRQL
jgi:hypothetical protein